MDDRFLFDNVNVWKPMFIVTVSIGTTSSSCRHVPQLITTLVTIITSAYVSHVVKTNERIRAVFADSMSNGNCFSFSFAMTKNYYVFCEQPLAINVATLLAAKIQNKPFSGALKFYPGELCRFYVISKADGKILETVFNAETFFCFHHVNAYEEEGKDSKSRVLASKFIKAGNASDPIHFIMPSSQVRSNEVLLNFEIFHVIYFLYYPFFCH